MATGSGMNGKATAEIILEESRPVALSARMHIRILKAEIQFLSEADAVSPELIEMMSSLVAVIQRASPETSQPRTPPLPTTRALHTPIKVLVMAEYIGAHYRHLIAQPGDSLIVYAKNKEMAIAYNARNDMAGQIPIELLNLGEAQPVAGSEICMPLVNSQRHGMRDLAWEAGDYVRICKWDNNRKSSGIGFNLASLEIGPFPAHMGTLKTIKPLDQLE